MDFLAYDVSLALLSALFGAAVGHYLYTQSPEVRLNLWGAKRRFSGQGGDIFITGGRCRAEADASVGEYDFRSDFVREAHLYHRYSDGIVVAHGRKVTLKCRFDCQDQDGVWYPHEIIGRGEYIGRRTNGFEGQVAMSVYVRQVQTSAGGRVLKRGLSWITVFYMHISAGGDMRGYWITEDFRNRGKFSFGWLDLRAESSW